jgi:hypothetical protein
MKKEETAERENGSPAETAVEVCSRCENTDGDISCFP